MADWMGGTGVGPGQLTDITTKLDISNRVLGEMLKLFTSLFPRSFGTFTMAAASSEVITDANVTSSSIITLMPTNAAAGTLMGSNESLYVTPASGSFTVTTAAGTAAAGTETFSYSVANPL